MVFFFLWYLFFVPEIFKFSYYANLVKMTSSVVRANAKIMHSRDAQCNTKELPWIFIHFNVNKLITLLLSVPISRGILPIG